MDELISKKDTLAKFDPVSDWSAYQIIKGMPSAEQDKWIAVEDRLPEKSDEFLVTVVDKEIKDYRFVGVAWFAHSKNYDIKESEWRELGIDETVIAWMPLPQPYKDGGE